ncbi:nucleotide sugar dehydrogenase [Kineococcus gynurae]|uniref:Nucleotide sugar dehydrogenase n=1 Tax=Kineococcus gynurae TaxID=452979 RepID=A0ABV5LRK7_9ACTN
MKLVVIGLGYVGLPLALEATRAGLTVTGLDTSEARVAALAAGSSHVDDISDAELAAAVADGFAATTDPTVLAGADVAVICVPTPLRDGQPDLSAVEAATAAVAAHLHAGMLVVLESTTYPGTTEDVVRPALEAGGLRAGTDFSLAFSPERIDPGNAHFTLRNTPKVVGGVTPDCTERAAAFYGQVVDIVVRVKSSREAEMAKLLENTYRHINIALVNEMAVFCHELGVDLWESIDAARTKPFGFQAFSPGPGVGGHCIPIDPSYLSYAVRNTGREFRFVELAQSINDGMPQHVVDRTAELLTRHGKELAGARVLLLGVTYKAGVADMRETPATDVERRFTRQGARVSYHDPLVPAWSVDGVAVPRVEDLAEALAGCDVAVLLTAHAEYDPETVVSRAPLLFDSRGHTRALVRETVEQL